jgi:hypothetical protein
MQKTLLITIALFSFINAYTQDTARTKLKVFVDCRADCDEQFFKTQITIIDFVIDRTAADAHVLITSQPVGSGGNQYQLNFYGQNNYKNYIDTLFFTTKPNTTPAEARESILNYLMLGLTPLISKTAYASELSVSVKSNKTTNEAAPDTSKTKDKWNYWVYTVSATGQLNAEKVYNTNILRSDLSANRTTDKLKVDVSAYGSLNNTTYDYPKGDSTTKLRVKNREYGIFHYLVKSLGPHWSIGYQVNFTNNTFTNIKSKLYFRPAIEYNIFNVKEVNNRLLAIRYGADVSNYRYYDTTVYDRISETRYGHKISATLTLNQKWGTINTGVYYRKYFKGINLNSMGMSANANVKITGSFTFFINIDATVVHDQINLVKSGATEQEVLTRKRQIASNFNYNTSFGVNFRFGSILNNFVNPRFQGYAGF